MVNQKNYIMKKFYLISLLMLFAYTANSQVNTNLQTTESYLTFTVDNNYDRVEINYPFSTKTTNTVQGKYGEPEIPVIQKRYVLPLNAEQISVQVTNSNLQTISGSYNPLSRTTSYTIRRQGSTGLG